MTIARPPEDIDAGDVSGLGVPRSSLSGTTFLDSILLATEQAAERARLSQDTFLREQDSAKALSLWWQLCHRDQPIDSLERMLVQISADIGVIDRFLNRQLNAILHHPRLQKLESSWRGLSYLVDQLEDDHLVKIRLLDVSWNMLVRDLDRSIEFDQSQLFRKVYSAEFDQPGGEPVAVLLGDYEIHLHPEPGYPTDDVKALRQISQVAAAAFCPFIAGAHPTLFGLDDFNSLERITNLPGIFQQPEYIQWNALRDMDDSRFLGLTMPRVLVRPPYRDDNARTDRFRFREIIRAKSDYLWGTSVFTFGSVLLRAFLTSGWLADIRGVRTDCEDAGLVANLPRHPFETDARGVAVRPSTDASIFEMNEALLSEQGFVPLCHCHGTEYAAFFSNASLQKPKAYQKKNATANARLSAMLQYIFCISRISHYVKVLGREKIGSLLDAEQCARYLNDWLQKYVLFDDQASVEQKAAHPLREAKVEVAEVPGKPGAFRCVMYLQPHYQFDVVATTFKLTTEMVPSVR